MSANTFTNRYRDELAYLRQLGHEFAQANPDIAGFLSRSSNDPDVERLLEGFAFLTAKLQVRIDNELPEFASGLLSLVWPQYLRPIPPMTIMQFDPMIQAGAVPVPIPAGTIVQAHAVQGVQCTFQTSYDIEALPLTITNAAIENRATSATLTLDIAFTNEATSLQVDFDKLRLHVLALRQPRVARTLYLWLSRQVRSLSVIPHGQPGLSLRPDQVLPVGFGAKEDVIPYPGAGFSGFRIVQEYFSLPQKFMFFDVLGLSALKSVGPPVKSFQLVFEFDRPFTEELRVDKETFALNATPAINLYPQEGQPITISKAKTEYRVMPSGDSSQTVHSITSVVGYRQGTGDRIDYAPFQSFRHDLPGEESDRLYYQQRTRPSIVGRGADHFLAFVTNLDEDGWPATETISLKLMCSNGARAERLGIGSVTQPTARTPGNVSFRNIDRVTPEIQPPVNDNLMWRLIANLARNFGSLVDADALKTVIAAYDFQAIRDVQARQRLELMLDGILEFTATPTDIIAMGRPYRGRSLELTVNEEKFGGEGEAFLFGAVMNEFFNAYASVNSVHILKLYGRENNATFTWPPRQGEAAPY